MARLKTSCCYLASALKPSLAGMIVLDVFVTEKNEANPSW